MGCNICNIELNKSNRYNDRLHRCKDCHRAIRREYYKNNKDKECKRKAEYQSLNQEKQSLWLKTWKKKERYQYTRYHTDINFKLKHLIRNRLNNALKVKSWIKNSKFSEYIGCPKDKLIQHIESNFINGMTWENHGEWHIDHIIPLSIASSEEELYKLCHYTNLQPLWAIDNLRKGGKCQ